MSEELKPCPFHNCLTCGCYDIIDISDKTWNKRPEENRLKAEIDRLLTRQGEMLDAMNEMRAWLNDPAYVIVPTVANNLKAIIARVMG